MRAAAVGIGSNSTRLLAGELANGRVAPFLRLREDTRLFAGLTEGSLSTESMLRTAAAAAFLCARARAEGCEHVRLFATSATRDAANGAAFAALVEARCGQALEVLSGAEEAELSFLGATGGGQAARGVLDIGGGSTELACGAEGNVKTCSLQLGSSRLLRQFPDFPAQREEALRHARGLVREGWRSLEASAPSEWVCVGGGGHRLAVAELLAQGRDPSEDEGFRMTRETAARWAERLCAMTLSERACVPGLSAARAPVAAHGAVLLQAAMEALEIASVRITVRTNLDGALLRLARAAE